MEPDALTAPTGLAGLVRDGVLDAELAGLVWLGLDGGLSVIAAGEIEADRRRIRDAVVPVAGERPVVRLRGAAETFAWMPEAASLGWSVVAAPEPAATGPGNAGRSAILVADLVPPGLSEEPGSGTATWGDPARLAIRAITAGYALAATAGGSRLEDVLARLAAGPVWAIDDELTQMGIVLIAGPDAAGSSRILAAHYLRPAARDVHDHIQRLPPAVLATWSDRTGGFDHFAWGVLGELAGRTGRKPLAFEREQARRAGLLAAAAGAPDG